MENGLSSQGPRTDARPLLRYFTWAFIVTAVGLVLGAYLGWQMTGTVGGMLTIFFICLVLAVLEISLSFDNAIVNANKLKTMTPVWQRRFLTWGIVIAVFGMRIVFPLLIVVIAARIGPWEAVVLAAARPEEYARIMHDAHLPIAAFGGTFLTFSDYSRNALRVAALVAAALAAHSDHPVSRAIAAGLTRGSRASVLAAFACTIGIAILSGTIGTSALIRLNTSACSSKIVSAIRCRIASRVGAPSDSRCATFSTLTCRVFASITSAARVSRSAITYPRT